MSVTGPATLGASPELTHTIIDSESQPVVEFAALTSSVNEGATIHEVDVTLSGAAASPISVQYVIAASTATNGAGQDFEAAATGLLTFAAGSTGPQKITVTIHEDVIDELSETVTLDLQSPTVASLGTVRPHVITIFDNDPTPTVSFAQASSSGDEDSSTETVEVTLSALSDRDVSVQYVVSGGTATSGSDFTTASGGWLVFPANSLAPQNIQLNLIEDTVYEGDETVALTLQSPVNAGLGAANHTFTILEDETAALLQFSQASSSVNEEATTHAVGVTLTSASATSVTVTYSISGGTAAAGVDYALVSGTLVFAPGDALEKFIDVPILEDSVHEGPETLTLALSANVGAGLGTPTLHSISIIDDEPVPQVVFQAAGSLVNEDDLTHSVPVLLSGLSAQEVTVVWQLSSGSTTATGGGADFTAAASGTLVFPALSLTPQLIAMDVYEDVIAEGAEFVVFNLQSPQNATVGVPASHSVTIADDEAGVTVAFTLPSSSVSEATSLHPVSIGISGASMSPVTVEYSVTGGDGAAGADYQTVTGQVVFAPGVTADQSFLVSILEDAVFEGNETVTIAITGATGALLGAQATHTLTILENESTPQVQFLSTNRVVTEEAVTESFDVALSVASDEDVTVPFSLGPATSASQGADFNFTPGSLVFPALTTGPLSVAITLAEDALHEPDEQVVIRLTSPVGASLGSDSSATLTIDDDEPYPVVAFALGGSTVTEGMVVHNVAVALATASSVPVTVSYQIDASSTAVNGSIFDYELTPGTIVFAAGSLGPQNIAVTIREDNIFEGASETVVLNLTAPVNANLGAPSTHTVTIAENDAQPEVQFIQASTTVSEGNTLLGLDVSLSRQSIQDVTVTYSTNPASASSTPPFSDFGAISGQLVFPAMSAANQSFSVSILEDSIAEATETFDVILSAPVNATLGSPSTQTVSITDSDTETIFNLSSCGNLPSGLTFTRGSSATFVGAGGLISPASVNQPRCDVDPEALTPLGLLIEETRTNIVPNSTNISAPDFLTLGSTMDNLNATAPDGLGAADFLREAATTDFHEVASVVPGLLGSFETWTFSVFVKANGRSRVNLWARTRTSGWVKVVYDLSTGTFVDLADEPGALRHFANNIHPNGWHRVSLTWNALTGASDSVETVLGLVDGSGEDFYLGDGASGVLVWGWQAEKGDGPSSFIPTTTAAATRAPDVAAIATSGWFNPSAGAFIYEFSADRVNPLAPRSLASVSAGSSSNGHFVFASPSGALSTSLMNAGVQTGLVMTSQLSGELTGRFGYSYRLNRLDAALNSVTSSPDITLNPPTSLTTLNLGRDHSVSGFLQGHLRRIFYRPTDQSLSFLTTNTQPADLTVPTILAQDGPAPGLYKTGDSLNFRLTFSESVNVVGSTIALSVIVGGTTHLVPYVAGSGTRTLFFRYTISPGDQDLDGLTFASTSVGVVGSSIRDRSGNAAVLTFSPQNMSGVLVDTSDPQLTAFNVSPGTYKIGDTLAVQATFSENVVVTGVPTLALNLGSGSRSASYVSGSGTNQLTFSYVISEGDLDLDGVWGSDSSLGLVAPATVTDAAGNAVLNSFAPASFAAHVVDGVRPIIASVSGPGPGTYGIGANLDFQVTFSENVTASGIILPIQIGGNTRNANLASVVGNSATLRYTVQAGDVDTDGIAISPPNLTASGTVADSAGNAITNRTLTPPNLSGVLVDATGPTVTSVVPPSNGVYLEGQTLNFAVNFSEAVNVSGGAPTLDLVVGSTNRSAALVSGSGTAQLVFSYTVTASDVDADGVSISSLVLGSSAIQDAASNAASLSFTPPVTPLVLVDGRRPVITLLNLAAATVEGNVAPLEVQLSQAVLYSITVPYSIAPISAISGSDFTGSSGNAVIPAGSTSVNLNFPTLTDGLVEGAEAFTVNLEPGTTPSGLSFLNAVEVVTILDLDSPSLSLDLTDCNSLIAASAGSFSRASTGTYFDVNGVMNTAAADQPRCEWDPATREPLGLLAEGMRTNLINWSRDLEKAAFEPGSPAVAYFHAQNLDIQANAAMAPDGTLSAELLRANDSASQGGGRVHLLEFRPEELDLSPLQTASENFYTFSAFVKPVGLSAVRLEAAAQSATQTTAGMNFDLASGRMSTELPGAIQGWIQTVGQGWYRVAIARDMGSDTAINPRLRLILARTWTESVDFDADEGETSGLLVWGLQLERGSGPTSFIPTSGADVTRQADRPAINSTDYWFNGVEGSFLVETRWPFLPKWHRSVARPTTFHVSEGNGLASSHSIAVFASTQPNGVNAAVVKTGALVVNAGTVHLDVPHIAAATPRGEFARDIVVFNHSASLNQYRVAENGAVIQSAAPGTVSGALSELSFGNMGGASGERPFNGHIRRFNYFPRARDSAELVNDTTPPLRLTIADPVIAPEGANAVIPVEVGPGTPVTPITFEWATLDLNAKGGSDFQSVVWTQATIPSAQSAVNLTVPVFADAVSPESGERFAVLLRNANGARIQEASGVVEIADQAPIYQVNFSGPAVVEDSESAPGLKTLTVNLSGGNPGSDVTVEYTVSGTMTLGQDYTGLASTGELIFPSGVSTQTLTFTLQDDLDAETTENLVVRLVRVTTPGIAKGLNDTVEVRVADNDFQPWPNALVRYIHPTCSGYEAGTCYTSLQAWQSDKGGTNGDLALLNIRMLVRIEGSWAAAEPNSVAISGWTTSASNFIRIETLGAARHEGFVSNTGPYRLDPPAGSSGLVIAADHTVVNGVRVHGVSGAGAPAAIVVNATGVTLENLLIDDVSATSGDGVRIGSANSRLNPTLLLRNSIFQDIHRSAFVIDGKPGATAQVHNVTAYNVCRDVASGCGSGAYGLGLINSGAALSTGAEVELINSIVHSPAAPDLWKTPTSSYGGWGVGSTHNATSDGSAVGLSPFVNHMFTDTAAPGPGDWIIVQNLNPATLDLRLVNTAANDAINRGSAILNLPLTDINGDARSGNPDLGADEASGAGVTPQTLMLADTVVEEGNTAMVTVFLPAPVAQNVVFHWYTEAVSVNDSDYTFFDVSSAQAAQISAGTSAVTLNIPTQEDGLDEANEFFRVRIAVAQNAVIGSDFATVTIADDDIGAPLKAFNLTVCDGVAGKLRNSGPEQDILIARAGTNNASYIGNDGVMRYVSANIPRCDHHPLTLEPLGLLVEGATTNLLRYSSGFEDGLWLKDNVSVLADLSTGEGVLAVDGTYADFLREDSTTGAHGLRQTFTASNGTTVTFSVYARQGGRDKVRLSIVRRDGLIAQSWFDLKSMLPAGSPENLIDRRVQILGSWLRLSITADVGFGAAGPEARIRLGDDMFAEAYLGDGYDGIFLFGAQVEMNRFVSSYIPTMASTVTRPSDDVTVNNPAQFQFSQDGTILLEAYQSDAVVTTPRTLLSIDNGSTSLYRLRGSGGPTQWVFDQGQAGIFNSVSLSSMNLTEPSHIYTALAYDDPDDLSVLGQNGLSLGAWMLSDGSSQPSGASLTAVRLGAGSPFASFFGHLRALTFWDQDFSRFELAQITQVRPTVSLVAGSDVTEASGTFTVTATVSQPFGATVNVPFAIEGMVDTSGPHKDYELSATQFTFGPNETVATVTVTIYDDALDEEDEDFVPVLRGGAAYHIGSQFYSFNRILDNDLAPMVSISGASVSEGAGQAVLTVSLSAPSGRDVHLSWNSSSGTATGWTGSFVANTDFQNGSGTLVIPAYDTTATITITPIEEDDLYEGNEYFTVDLAPHDVTMGGTFVGNVDILDNDAAPTVAFSVPSSTGNEGSVENLQVTLSRQSAVPVTVDFTYSGTGISAGDFTIGASPGSFVIPAFSVSPFTLPVGVTADLTTEGIEVAQFNLTSALPGSVGIPATHALTINDTSVGAMVNLSFANLSFSVGEGNSFALVLNLSVAHTQDVRFQLTFSNDGTGTFNAPAASGGDLFIDTSQEHVIPAGSTSISIPVYTFADSNSPEMGESGRIGVNLVSSPGVAFTGGSAQVTFIDDPDLPVITIAETGITVVEGEVATVAVTMDRPSTSDVTFQLAAAGGTAVQGAVDDYLIHGGPSYTIPAGQTRGFVPVATHHRTVVNGSRPATLRLQNPANATILGGSTDDVTLTINDNTSDYEVTHVAAGSATTCAVVNGGVMCWGVNTSGALGRGSASPLETSLADWVQNIGPGSGATRVSVGFNFACAVVRGGVQCWGAGTSGQLGNGASLDSNAPVQVSGLGDNSGVIDVSVDNSHACALVVDRVKCWGSNGNGQLGDGTLSGANTPMDVRLDAGTLLSKVTQISVGLSHVCAIASGGLVCWGNNGLGQLNKSVVGVNFPYATWSDEFLAGAGVYRVSTGTGFTCVAVGSEVRCMGQDNIGQLGDGTAGGSRASSAPASFAVSTDRFVQSLFSGDSFTCALMDHGTFCWGVRTNGVIGDGGSTTGSQNSPKEVTGYVGNDAGVSQLAAGSSHACALIRGGVECWGSRSNGRLGIIGTGAQTTPIETTTIKSTQNRGLSQIALGDGTGCITRGGRVYCWGNNSRAQAGADPLTAPMVLGPTYVMGIESSAGGEGVTKVGVGKDHACAITRGRVECWGWMMDGRLGNGTNVNASSAAPVVAGALNGVTDLAVSSTFSCAVARGNISCWGRGDFDQLSGGIGLATTPTVVSGLPSGRATHVAAGPNHVCAIVDTQVYCWGDNTHGQIGYGSTGGASVTTPAMVLRDSDNQPLSGATSLALGEKHSCAVVGSEAYCWGANNRGQLGNVNAGASIPRAIRVDRSTGGQTLVSVSEISAGGESTCAVANSGLVCWGSQAHHQLGVFPLTTDLSWASGLVYGFRAPDTGNNTGGVAAMAVGAKTTCASKFGQLHCWGNNASAGLGILQTSPELFSFPMKLTLPAY